jgi:hypothetical protein
MDKASVFTASRLTAGNFLFPARLEVSRDRVARVKPSFWGSNEESVAMSKVASINIDSGAIWSDIRIDSTGGTNPILSHGHRKADAQEIRALIERFQKDGR